MEKIYVGNGKEKFDGNLVNISLCLSDLPKEHIFEYNGKKYIKLNVVKKKQEDQYGKTHFVDVDTFKPESKNNDLPETDLGRDETDDLPF